MGNHGSSTHGSHGHQRVSVHRVSRRQHTDTGLSQSIWTGTFSKLLKKIGGMSAEDKLKATQNPRVVSWLASRSPGEQRAAFAALLTGNLTYKNPPESDFYKGFVTDGSGTVLASEQSCNCWEFIFYAAVLSEQLDAKYYKQHHGGKWTMETLGSKEALPITPGNEPAIGDLVFLTDAKRTSGTPQHVMLYAGNGQVLTHDGGQLAQLIDLAYWGTVNFKFTFVSPPWSRPPPPLPEGHGSVILEDGTAL